MMTRTPTAARAIFYIVVFDFIMLDIYVSTGPKKMRDDAGDLDPERP
jgi:hypothetical protein